MIRVKGVMNGKFVTIAFNLRMCNNSNAVFIGADSVEKFVPFFAVYISLFVNKNNFSAVVIGYTSLPAKATKPSFVYISATSKVLKNSSSSSSSV